VSAAAKRTALAAVSIVALLTVCVVGPAEGRNSGPRDQVPPTAPTDVHVVKATPSAVYVAWQPAQDDVEVAGYVVYGDTGKKTVSAASYIVSGLGCGQSSALSVSAYDRSGNRSPRVTALVATAACPDTQPPSQPAGFKQLVTTPTAVVLSWSPSTDNVGVVGYGVFQGTSRVAAISDPTVALSGLACGNSYSYLVDAVDAAGNRSLLGTAYVATSACGDSNAPTAPSNLALTAKTQTSLSLGWTGSSDDVGIAGYRVLVGGVPRMSVTQTNATLAGLECDKSYAIGVDAYDAAGNRSAAADLTAGTDACPSAPPAPPAPTPDTTPPSVPGALAVSNVAQTSMTLQWSASNDNVGVTGYDVYRNSSKVASVTSTSSSQSGLACGTTYQYEVVARDAAGNASQPARASAATAACATPTPPPPPPSPPADTTPPSQPTGLTVSGATRTSLSLTWAASSDNVAVTGYRILVNGTPNGTSVQPGATVSSLTCGTGYTVEVEAYDAAGNRSTRASVVASTSACADTQPPSAPTNVVTTNRTSTSIALSWNPSSDNVGVSGYGLYRGGTSAGTSSTTNAVLTGLACNTNYTLAVDAYDAAGNRSTQTAVMVSTTACADTAPPSAPTGLGASNVTQTGLSLSWNASSDNTGVTGYDVYRNATKMTTVTSTSATQSGLACGTSYTFGVVARDAAGNSSPQASIQVQTSACSAPAPAPAPAPTAWSGPITITQGGTYSGSWESTSGSTPAVKIATTSPVTITGRIRNLAGGTLVDAAGGGAVQVTLDHVFAYGGGSYQTSGRFFRAFDFKSITIRNSTIEYTRGIELTYGVAGSSVLITRNRHTNIQGNGESTVGDFVQLREVQNASVEISWNEVLNEYNESNPEDIISLFKSANVRVHDNYLQHNSKPGNAYNTSTQGTITLDRFDNVGPACHDNEIWNNQMVDTVNGVAISGSGSYNNFIHDNRLIQDGKLPNGTQMGNGWGGFYMTAGTANRLERNVSGYVNRDGIRKDWDSGTNPSLNTTLPDSITQAMELAESTSWKAKLAANGITIGA
jgi:chitodextrinase